MKLIVSQLHMLSAIYVTKPVKLGMWTQTTPHHATGHIPVPVQNIYIRL